MTTRYTVSPPWLAGGVEAANCIAAYMARGVASYAASLVNLANPGTFTLSEDIVDYDCEPMVSPPTWDADGWAFDRGDGEYTFQALDTGIKGADMGKGTGSAIVFFSGHTPIADYQYPFMASLKRDDTDPENTHGTLDAYIGIETNTDGIGGDTLITNGALTDEFFTYSSGVIGFSGQNRYGDGTLTPFVVYDIAQVPPWNSLTDDIPSIYIGAQHKDELEADGTPYYPSYGSGGFTGTIEAVAFYNVALTEAQLDAISAAFAAYWADAGTPAREFTSAARTTTFRSVAR